ncbi:MAG: methylated-DNA--[protein]-cysteine S-methyltransferase [Candidatus Pseudobacter hemicellulosilyticus]|uniref:Methylated-DNA--protein-cysteine methyltransferase n=1 Tax=Candidatus Pseudobacter hemicellulosilyticus TaxID=3121375 RepID=A0AAJ5WTW9_9BACT|nr:MAG: methylated-DNA--[protein]-cysteine S-methyltransferase [Pseudobacter sp.]
MPPPFTTYYQSPVGLLRLSGTEHYLSEVCFIDNSDQLPPDDASAGALPPLAIQATEELIQYFHGDRRSFELPVSQSGTEFQQKVWSELVNIPFGKTISYQELARRLGDPKVIRAAASTNGKNQLAIIVPCHRVIGAKNDLVGYAGGLWRKRWLLEHEKKIAHGVLTLF